jgi:penicillin amidase
MRFQTDNYLKSAEFLLGRIKDHRPLSPGSGAVLESLLKWDRRADSGPAPTLFYRFEKILAAEMFADEFPDEEGKMLVSRAWIYRLLNYPSGEADPSVVNDWADDRKTGEIEIWNDIVERSLRLTHEDLERRKEDNGWEGVHQLTFRHPLGSVFGLKHFLNRGPFGMKGGKDCVMVASFGNRDDFSVSHLSTFRMIIDMNDHTNSRMINSSGQSGHFMSRFYDDQIGLYVRGGYRAMENAPEGKYRIVIHPGGKE